VKPLTHYVRRFRSKVSGMWYENPHAAGAIDAVEINGHILIRNPNEGTWNWIKRASEWAKTIHKSAESNEVNP